MPGIWILTPSPLKGEVSIPSARNALHRAIIAASLCEGKSIITPFIAYDELRATLNVMKALGATYTIKHQSLTIKGINPQKNPTLKANINDSLTTLKLTLPLILSLNLPFTYIAKGIELDASITALAPITQKGSTLKITKAINDLSTLKVSTLKSARLISGFLLAAPFFNPLPQYDIPRDERPLDIVLTLDTMKQFHIDLIENDTEINLPKHAKYMPKNIEIEGDYGIGGFFLIAGLKSASIRINNIKHSSHQSDFKVVELIKSAKGKIIYDEFGYFTTHSPLEGFKASMKQHSGLVPHAILLASLSNGASTLIKLKHYKHQNARDLEALLKTLSLFNIAYKFHSNTLIIYGTSPPFKNPKSLILHPSFRIALFQVFMASFSNKIIKLYNTETITFHYPGFLTLMQNINGNINTGKPLNKDQRKDII